jgi:hypothetical protein
MTILLLQPYATFAKGETVSLDNATEAALVDQQLAEYTLDPGPVFFTLTAAEQQRLRDALADDFGSGGGGGGGDDVTAWGGFTGGVSGDRPTLVTVNGVQQTIAYIAGTNNIESYTIALAGAADIVTTVNYNNGFEEAAGNIIRGTALTMTEAQAKALRDEVLVGLGQAAIGFRLRISGLNTFKDSSGTSTGGTWALEWDGRILRPVGACVLQDFLEATYNNDSAESAALSSLTPPIWLLKPGLKMVVRVQQEAVGGTTGTLRTRIKIGGVTSFYDAASGSGTSATNIMQCEFIAKGDAAQTLTTVGAIATGGTAVTGAAASSTSIDTTAANVAFTVTAQSSIAEVAKVITHRYFTIGLENA